MSCIEGKGVVNTFPVVHKMLRYLLIYYEIYFELANTNQHDIYVAYQRNSDP